MTLFKRHPVIVNLVLSFFITAVIGFWINFLTGSEPMSDRQHLLLVSGILLLGGQCWYNVTVTHIEKKIINNILDLGTCFFMALSSKVISSQYIRGFVHLCEQAVPGASLLPQRCLVPRYWKSPVEPPDFGAIPLDDELFKKWYVNVQAFHEQAVICDVPILKDRPIIPGAPVINHFLGTLVISVPIWSRADPPSVIGTLTFDFRCPPHQLRWAKNGVVDDAVKDMLVTMADLIGKVLSDGKAST